MAISQLQVCHKYNTPGIHLHLLFWPSHTRFLFAGCLPWRTVTETFRRLALNEYMYSHHTSRRYLSVYSAGLLHELSQPRYINLLSCEPGCCQQQLEGAAYIAHTKSTQEWKWPNSVVFINENRELRSSLLEPGRCVGTEVNVIVYIACVAGPIDSAWKSKRTLGTGKLFMPQGLKTYRL
jgi:hypothetical protein